MTGAEVMGLNKLTSLLLYAGLEPAEFDALKPLAVEENRKNIKVYAMISTGLFLLLIAASAVTRDFARANVTIYIIMAAISAVICVCAGRLPKRSPRRTMALSYAFALVLYAFSISITMLHLSRPAVTTIVLLLAIPFLLVDRPIRLAALTALVTAALCALSARYKDPNVASSDIWNGISFGAVGVAAVVLQMRTRFKMLAQNRKIEHMSQTDALTGAKNRNSFEQNLSRYAAKCAENIICVYADVNGLHDLNDTKGHRAGDAMLQAVARELIAAFGAEHTYRVGGDEFVCFRVDAPEDAALEDLRHVCGNLKMQGYNLSVGAASEEKARLNMIALTGAAEAGMYQDKRRFYEQSGRDRRRR